MDTRTLPAGSDMPVVSDLESRLDHLRNILRRTTFIGGAALVVRLLCICLAVAFLIDVVWDAPRGLRIGLLLATLAAVGVVAFLRIVRPMFRRVSHEELAALVESAHPEMEERLLSSLELARSADRDALKGSAMMREQLLRETAKATRNVEFDAVVDSSAAVRQTVIACVAFVLVLAPFVVLQDGYGNVWARFFNPWGNYAHGTTLTIEVQPGDAVVPRGEDVPVTAIPHFRFTKSKALSSPRVTWIDDDGEREFRDLKSVPDQPSYAAVIPQVSRGLRYRIESGEGASREYRVQVVDRPMITGLTVDVHPPAYCGRPAQRIDGLVGETTVFERSTLKFTATFNKPVAELRWLWVDDVRHKYDGKPLEAHGRDRLKSASVNGLAFARDDAKVLSVDADGKSASWELTADREGAFEIVLIDSAGIQNRNEPGRSFRILRDAAPVIAWADNENLPTAKSDDVVAFEVTASDDIGLGALELHYSVLPHRTQAAVLKTDPALLGGQQFTNRFPIDLRKLTVPEGSLVAVKARAADERPVPGPNEAWTSERIIAISKDAAAFGSSELNQRHQKIRDQLAALRQEAAARESEAQELKQKAREGQQKGIDEQVFKSQADQLSDREEQLKERIQQTAAELQREGMMANLSPKLNLIAAQDVVPAFQETEKARDATQDGRAPALQKAEQELGEATQKLAQTEQKFEELAKLEKDLLELNRIADKTERLANDVGEFEQQRRELAKTEGESPQNKESATSTQSAAQKELETQRKQLQQEQKELSRNLQDVLNRRPEVLEAARADLMERLKNLGQRAEKLAEKEERLSDALKQAGQENALALQQRALEQEQLQKQSEQLAAELANEQRQRLVPQPDLSKSAEAAEQLQKGNPQAAAEAQRKAAEELEQLARALEQNQQLPADPQQAAQALAKRQQEIKDELQKAVDDAKQRKSAAAEGQMKKLAAEQAAIQAATAQLQIPPASEPHRNEALKDGGQALEEMLSEKPENAVGSADRAKQRLEQLSKDIGTPDEREKRLARDADHLRWQQQDIAKALEKKRDDDRAAGRQPAADPGALGDQLSKQRELARQAANMDVAKAPNPGKAAEQQSEAVRAAVESLQKMQSGTAEEAAPAARAAEQALADLQKTLKNEPTADEQLERLVKEQKDLEKAAGEALKGADSKAIEQVRQRQQKQAEHLERMDAPQAVGLTKAAAEQARQASRELEAAKGDEGRRPAAEESTKKAGEALDRLSDAMQPSQSPAERAKQLAADQKARAGQAQASAGDPSQKPIEDEPRQIAAAQEMLNQLPAAGAAQQKQAAAKALDAAKNSQQKLAEAQKAERADATEPSPELKQAVEANAARQNEAAAALDQLADQLARPESQRSVAAAQREAAEMAKDARNPRTSDLANASQAAAKLADEQSKLREKTQPLVDGLPDKSQQKSQMDAARAAQQKLAQQIGQLNPGVNPLARAEAEAHARAAEKALAASDAAKATQEQAAAQQNLEQLARSAQSQQQQLAASQSQPSDSQPAAGSPMSGATPPQDAAGKQSQASQQSSAAKSDRPSDAERSKQLAQRARDLAAAQRQAAEAVENSQKPGSDQLASAAGQQKSSRPGESANPTTSSASSQGNPAVPTTPSTDPKSGEGGSAEKSSPDSKGTDAEKGQGRSKQPPRSDEKAPPEQKADQGPPGQSTQRGEPSQTPGTAPGQGPGAEAPGTQPGPNAGPNAAGSQPGPGPGTGPDGQPGQDGQPTMPGGQGQASQPGVASDQPAGQTPAEAARSAVARQQQVSQDIAAAALEAASQAPGSKVADAAVKMAQVAAEASYDASVGATSRAARAGRQMASQARELAKQLDENPVAQGGPQPEMAERMRQLAQEQEQAAGQLSQVGGNRDSRNAAQAQGQRQLKQETQKLEKDFAELAEQLKAQPVDRKRQSEQAGDAKARSEGASREMQQAMQSSQKGDSGQAAEAAQSAAQELRKAARMAREERAYDPGKSPNNPVPNETGSQVADAARELQKAGELLAQKNPSQPGDQQTGKPGEKSKMDASQQAGDSKKNQDGKENGGEMQPQDSGNEGLAQGQEQQTPPQASEMLKQGAHSLRQAASQLKLRPGESGNEGQQSGGEQGESQPTSSQTKQGSASGANEQVRIVDVKSHLDKMSNRNWGELPGKLQTEILQSTRRRPDGDYAPLIRRYFDTISKTQPAGGDGRED